MPCCRNACTGASLSLCAQHENHLKEVAEECRALGARDINTFAVTCSQGRRCMQMACGGSVISPPHLGS